MYEVPDGVYLERTDTSIIISSDKTLVRGRVIATLQNGELVCTRDAETREAIITNGLVGIVFVLLYMSVCGFLNEKKKLEG